VKKKEVTRLKRLDIQYDSIRFELIPQFFSNMNVMRL